MEISYKLENFEGPLDLLLKLIEKNKVSIFDIPIEVITDQYLDYVRRMEFQDLDLLSDFLVMAATLLDIKSRMLLPAEDLVQRLLEYKMYKYISRELEEYEEKAERVFYREPRIPKEVAKYEPPVNLDEVLAGLTKDQLHAIFKAVMRRSAMRIDPVRSGFGTIRREPVSLEETVASVMQYARTRRHFSFRQVIREKHDRVHVVVAFLAVLELMKIGKIRLTQESLFDDMNIETIEPEGETGEVKLEGLEDFDGE